MTYYSTITPPFYLTLFCFFPIAAVCVLVSVWGAVMLCYVMSRVLL